ncbi:MAG TPA: diguanylate cyclase [Planctomycetes bacterium]|jgi:two-component system chemotaxis response regulator CheY|nr:diguanylate cyclase [Planctomycetota bacterium]
MTKFIATRITFPFSHVLFLADKVTTPTLNKTMKILIADDDPVSTRVLAHQLEKWQHVVTTTTNGIEALDAFKNYNFDVVITDWMMPAMSGPELCAAIREEEKSGELASFIILLTSRGSNEDFALALEAGANDFATKPFAPFVLQARLANAARIVQLQTELHRKKQEADKLACTDYLTQLRNRRAMWQNLGMDFERMSREQRPLSALVIDIDFFKKINDAHGHQTGDYVLQAVADCLTNSVRSGDYVGRWGGEEFLAVLPGADIIQSAEVAERCRHHLESLRIKVDSGEVIRLSASFGVAAIDGAGREDCNALIEQADQALYWAKDAGRNRVKIYVPGVGPRRNMRKAK